MPVNRLSVQQTRQYENILATKYKYRYRYGNPSNQSKKTVCERVRNLSDNYKHNSIAAAKIACEVYVKRKLNANKVLCHSCAEPYPGRTKFNNVKLRGICLTIDHMHERSRKENMERKQCHNYIRKYEKQYRMLNPKKPRKGPLFVNDINRWRGIVVDNKTGKRVIKFRCKHNPKCFINYGLILD
eukprot:75122_1